MDELDEDQADRLELLNRVTPPLREYSMDTSMDVVLMILADMGTQMGWTKAEFLTEMITHLGDLYTEIMENEHGNSTHH